MPNATEVVIWLNDAPLNCLEITVDKYRQLLLAILEDATKIAYSHNQTSCVKLSLHDLPNRFDKIMLQVYDMGDDRTASKPSDSPEKLLPAQTRTLKPFIPSIPFFSEDDVVRVEYQYPPVHKELAEKDAFDTLFTKSTPKQVSIEDDCLGGYPCKHCVHITEHDNSKSEQLLDAFTIYKRFMFDIPIHMKKHFHEATKLPYIAGTLNTKEEYRC